MACISWANVSSSTLNVVALYVDGNLAVWVADLEVDLNLLWKLRPWHLDQVVGDSEVDLEVVVAGALGSEVAAVVSGVRVGEVLEGVVASVVTEVADSEVAEVEALVTEEVEDSEGAEMILAEEASGNNGLG
jgi:hypothetical protein